MSFAEVNGVSLRYDWRPGSGAPLVLLHEIGGALESWDLVLRHLPEDRAVLRLDLRGFGLSEKPTTQMTAQDHIADVMALMAHLGIQTAILSGCAVGGGIAIAVAAALGANAKGLLALAPATGVPAERRPGLHGLADMLEAEGARNFLEVDTIPKAWPTPRFDRNSEGFQIFLATQFGTAPTSLGQIYRMLAAMDIDALLPEVECPAIFVSGQHDIARPKERVAPLAVACPNGRFIEIDSGHFMALQSPEDVARLLLEF